MWQARSPPEIKPGKYSYKDKEKFPGLKELMIPHHYKRFNPGGPPFAGNFPEITVVPTKQYYWALPIAEATKNNMGKTKLDDQGYIIDNTYVSGYPFPRPSGKFKVQQIMYNWVKRYSNGESLYLIETSSVDGILAWRPPHSGLLVSGIPEGDTVYLIPVNRAPFPTIGPQWTI